MHDADQRYAARLAAYGATATSLAMIGDRRLGELVASAAPIGAGIGGRAAELDVDGTRVFVKRVPLTDLEIRPEHLRSTANLFDLPLFYQYGLGSSGFGTWRELAVHTATTNWVLTRENENFPLMYHWRVLPDTPPEGFVDGFGGIDGAVAHWDGSPAVRARLEAIGGASHSLVLFLEHVPHTLAAWLHEHAHDHDAIGPLLEWAEHELLQGADFMASRGLVHFDAHLANVLTDGRQLYFADFGLALSAGFDLSPAEERFHRSHLGYDRHHTASHLLRHHAVGSLRGDTDPYDFLQEWIAGRRPADVRPEIASVIDRHARATVVLHGFNRRMLAGSKLLAFPSAELHRAAALSSSPSVSPSPGTESVTTTLFEPSDLR